MLYKTFLILPSLLLLLALQSCSQNRKSQSARQAPAAATAPEAAPEVVQLPLQLGAEQTMKYLPLLQDKRVGLVVNHTSLIGSTHLVDSLLSHQVQVVKIFAPEHGFRGEADAGAYVKSSTDVKTGLPIVSLYGKNKKPTAEQVKDLDVLVFDIQDVGARFYTYISTMHYVMEACAENGKQLLVLDRPNPNGSYVDGPVLEKGYESFVGLHPIPVVHGLTVGELAQMINGEKWLANQQTCQLTVVPLQHYNHNLPYPLPVKPSPNLPNDLAIRLYPSLCLFEGTNVSVGRGTETPFQVIGSPFYKNKSFSFTPKSMPGAASPPHLNQTCYGLDLTGSRPEPEFTLRYVLELYHNSTQQDKFFNDFFEKLAGNGLLRKQIIEGKTEAEIRATWQPALEQYKQLRQKYLLYP